jgi:hypothetical protein
MHRRSALTASCPHVPVFFALALAGCSTAASETAGAITAAPRADAASSPEDSEPPTGGLAELKDPDDGLQLRSAGVDIAPGEDVEYCEIAELPGDENKTYFVKTVELANAPYSHHLVVGAAIPGTDADAALRQLNVGDRIQCNGANYQWPQDGLVLLGSAQTPYISVSFPDGVGTQLYGKQRIVFDYHYLNVSQHSVRAQSGFNVHVVDGATIKHLATPFSIFNFTLDIPAHGSRSFTAESHFLDDLKISSILRHTHKQGRDFSVWFSGGERDGELIWTSRDWKNEPEYYFEEPIVMKAGEGFRFECDFENASDRRLRYGIGGSDEMCILAGWAWPAGDAKQLPPENYGITWIDRAGIGHPAAENGGFPPASAAEVKTCMLGLGLTGASALGDGCDECICNSCGDVLLKCSHDPDCSALLACFERGCGDANSCVQACATDLHDHSSAVGMLQQVQSCLATKCAACSPTGN